MINHETIEIFSSLWWKYTLIALAVIVVLLFIAIYINKTDQERMRVILGISFLLAAIGIHPYLIYLDKWSLQSSLPLHLCTLSAILSGIVMLNPKQKSYEFLIYWGIPGGIHSMLTPEFPHGTEGLLVFEYYFLHGNIIFSSLFLTFIVKMKPGKNSWFNVFLWTQFCIPVIGGLNYLFNSNYMYLAEKPLADNPFIVGEWPWYILGLEVGILFHFYLIYLLFKSKKIDSFSLSKI